MFSAALEIPSNWIVHDSHGLVVKSFGDGLSRYVKGYHHKKKGMFIFGGMFSNFFFPFYFI
jgi:hypothetical protein